MIRRIKKPTKISFPWLGRDGQTLILVVLAMTVLMGMAAAGVTVSTVYFSQTRLQNAADAAALAGAGDAAQQNFSAVPGESQLISQDSPGGTGNLTLNQTNETVTAYASTVVPPSFAGVFGFKGFPVKVRAVASYNGGGAFQYAIFQGSDNPLTVNGHQQISGNAHSNGSLSFGGASNVTGACTAGEGLAASGNCGSTPSGSYVPMPIWYPNQIPNPINLATYCSVAPGDNYCSVSSKIVTISGNLPAGNYYVSGDDVSISGGQSLTGSITVYNGTITLSGNPNVSGIGGLALASFGNASGITCNGNFSVTGVLYAPEGTITLNGGGNGGGGTFISGAVIAQNVTLHGNIHVTWNGQQTSAVPVHQVVLLQ